MTEDSVHDLKEFREMVNQSAEHTRGQLQNIDTNLFFGSMISIVLAVGISFQLKILLYWIPASFLFICLWTFYSLISTKNRFAPDNVDRSLQNYQNIDTSKIDLSLSWFFRTTAPIIKGISLIYATTLVILVLVANKTIPTANPFSLLIPTITALLYVPLPFLVDNFIGLFERGLFTETLNDMVAIKNNVKYTRWKFIVGAAKIILSVIGMISAAVLPFLALYTVRSLIDDLLFLNLVLVLQIVVVIVFASYFSALSAKRELTNALTNFADINYQINDMLLSKELNEDDIVKLKKMYLTAKQYDLKIDDSLKIVNFYYLLMNRINLKRS